MRNGKPTQTRTNTRTTNGAGSMAARSVTMKPVALGHDAVQLGHGQPANK